MEEIHPKIRTAIILMKEEDVLLGEMKSGSEKSTWMFPWCDMEFKCNYYDNLFTGLWKDFGSRFRCTNIFIPYSDRLNPVAVVNDVFPEEHYITLLHRGVYLEKWSTLGIKNKEKYSKINWFKWGNLEQALDGLNADSLSQNKDVPYPLSLSIKNFLQQGYSPWKDLNIPETLKTKEC